MKWQKVTSLFIISSFLFQLTGCFHETATTIQAAESIELLEPVNAQVNSESCEYRNLYDATILSSYVIPYTKEYSFSKDVFFDHYMIYPGQSVTAGGQLIRTNTESIEKQIEDLDLTLEQLDASHEKYLSNIEDQINEKLFYSGVKANQDGETLEVQLMCSDIWTLRLQKEQSEELYQLDSEYYEGVKESLLTEKANNSLSSSMAGTVVSIAPLKNGDKILQDKPVISVGDPTTKLLRCEYISSQALSKAEEIYAIIDGEKYEIENIPVSSEEYNRLSSKGETVYSTFSFLSDSSNVFPGDYAVLVLINEERFHCLTVPNSSLHKDEMGNYVYVMENGTSTYRQVHTGMSDGVYTEIIDGLSEKEEVLVDQAITHKDETAILKSGEFHTQFESVGEAYYPSQKKVTNEIAYGTVYFVSYEAPLYSHVNTGDTIATITVSPNDLSLDRKSREMERLKEQLTDLDETWGDLCNDYYDLYGKDPDDEVGLHSISHSLALNRQSYTDLEEQITDLQEEIDEIQSAYQTTKIKAASSGIITEQLMLENQEIIPKGAVIAVISDESSCFIKVDNTNQLLNYGNQVTITYTDPERNTQTIEGEVVTVSNLATSTQLQSETVLVRIPEETVSGITQALMLPEGFRYEDLQSSWFDDWRKMFRVKSNVREMEHVCTVPKEAVWEINGKTYVFLKNPDGTIISQSFLSGGHDAENYWVIEGLQEGDVVCLK